MDHDLNKDIGHEGVPTHAGSYPSTDEDDIEMGTDGP